VLNELAGLAARHGQAALHGGQLPAAGRAFVEALEHWREVGVESGVRLSTQGLAGIAAAPGQLERAARLYAAAAGQAGASVLFRYISTAAGSASS
jgi:hypothetical protein